MWYGIHNSLLLLAQQFTHVGLAVALIKSVRIKVSNIRKSSALYYSRHKTLTDGTIGFASGICKLNSWSAVLQSCAARCILSPPK